MNFRTRSSRLLALLVLAGMLAARLGSGMPAAAFSVNAPNLPQITGNPSTSPTEESASPTPGASGSVPLAPRKGQGAARTSAPAAAPAAGPAAPAAAAPASSSNWPLIILLSVCCVGAVLIGLFFWSRREE